MILLMRHIEVVREKPHHIRKQIALGIAVVVTALIALLWLGLSLTTGAFALDTETSFGSVATSPEPAQNDFGGLVGAAAAVVGASPEPAHIEIVDTKVNSTIEPAEDPTIIPF